MDSTFEETDFFLNTLVAMAELGAGMNVVLHVNGSVITGNLISQKKYFSDLVDALRAPMTKAFPESHQSILDTFERLEQLENGKRAEGSDTFTHEFIHLMNTKFYTGDQLVPTNEGVLWRGKLHEVDGFSLGGISDS